MTSYEHGFPFDPTYGYALADLLRVVPPPAPEDFAAFWQLRYTQALAVDPQPHRAPSRFRRPGFRVWDLTYHSTEDFRIGGWLLEPTTAAPRLGLILGHGYGGIEQPDAALPRPDALYLVPCFRGLGRSRRPPISDDPSWHVLHDIQARDRYIIGGCVADLWTGVSALLALYPELAGRLGYLGISFGGGIGALALPWDPRVARGHLNVPTFGHQPLRLQLPTVGSAAAVQSFARQHGHVIETLRYYDAAVAARFIQQPMLVAAALFDPVVAPPGQFAIYNALAATRQLFVLGAGHFRYPGQEAQDRALLDLLARFFVPP